MDDDLFLFLRRVPYPLSPEDEGVWLCFVSYMSLSSSKSSVESKKLCIDISSSWSCSRGSSLKVVMSNGPNPGTQLGLWISKGGSPHTRSMMDEEVDEDLPCPDFLKGVVGGQLGSALLL